MVSTLLAMLATDLSSGVSLFVAFPPLLSVASSGTRDGFGVIFLSQTFIPAAYAPDLESDGFGLAIVPLHFTSSDGFARAVAFLLVFVIYGAEFGFHSGRITSRAAVATSNLFFVAWSHTVFSSNRYKGERCIPNGSADQWLYLSLLGWPATRSAILPIRLPMYYFVPIGTLGVILLPAFKLPTETAIVVSFVVCRPGLSFFAGLAPRDGGHALGWVNF